MINVCKNRSWIYNQKECIQKQLHFLIEFHFLQSIRKEKVFQAWLEALSAFLEDF